MPHFCRFTLSMKLKLSDQDELIKNQLEYLLKMFQSIGMFVCHSVENNLLLHLQNPSSGRI